MSSIKKNIAINFLGGIIPIIVGFLAIPITVKGLGSEAFGIMTIAWIVLGYFGLFDLGFSQATVKYASQYLSSNDLVKFYSIFWLSIYISIIMGLIGTILFFVLTPLIISSFLKIPSNLIVDAKTTFYILGLSLPLVILLSSLKGILAASNRFILINKIHTPLNILTYLIPCLSLPFNLKLPTVVALIVVLRLVIIIIYLIILYKLYPNIYKSKKADIVILKGMLTFGGWITMSNTISPLLVYLDRFFIGSIISMSAVTYYTAPYELIVRTRLFPNAIVDTLFPKFTSAMYLDNKSLISDLYSKALKYILLIMSFITLFVLSFGDLILNFWLGKDLAVNSISVFKILSLGVLFNAVTTLPFFLLQSAGRPDLPAKFHLIELIFFGIILYSLISAFGINGAALAWTLRVLLDSIFLFTSTYKLFPYLYTKKLLRPLIYLMILVFFIVTLFFFLDLYFKSYLIHFSISILSLILFMFLSWKFVLNSNDRKIIFNIFKLKSEIE
jgi:O-antigen/teichoic acid export membrane protein